MHPPFLKYATKVNLSTGAGLLVLVRDSTRYPLKNWLFFLNCYEWCKFPFTRWSVDIILSKEPVFLIFPSTGTLFCQMQKVYKVEQFAPPILLVQSIFTHVNNGITVGMWGKTHCFDVQCKLSRNSMHLSHSVNRVGSQLQPEVKCTPVRCKKCKHTRQEKNTIFRGKEKKPLFLYSSQTDVIPD
jgi:hypothetical protein